MAQLRRYLTSLVIALATGLTVQAGSPSGPERTVSFTVFCSEPTPTLAYIPYPDAATVPLAFYPTARSPQYSYGGPVPLQLFEMTTGRVVAEINFPAEVRTALLILTPDKTRPGETSRYQVRVVDDGTLTHAPGELLVLNISGLTLSGTINRRSVALQDGINAPIGVGESATINLRTRFKDRSYQAYADTIPLGPSGRALLLLLPPYHRGSLEVQSRVLVDSP